MNRTGMFLAAALYSLHFVGTATDRQAYSDQPPWAPAFLYARPSLVAFARNGTSAVASPGDRSGRQLISLVRRDGERMVLRGPSDAELARGLTRSEYNPAGPDTFPTVRFQSIVLASDGTLFANMAAPFAGAYAGTQEAAFRWSSGSWGPGPAAPAIGKQCWIAAADGTTGIALVEDELDGPPSQERVPDDALLLKNGRRRSLGRGIATAVRAGFASGYDAGFPGAPPRRDVEAWQWDNGRRRSLGPGVAWDVNSAGEVAGDDRRALNGAGKPTLWQRGKPMRLSDGSGSAFAIADDGTVVGAVGDDGFVIASAQRGKGPQRLDALVERRGGWHISSAFGIAADGSILAAASHGDAELRIVRLDPTTRGSR